MTVCFPSRAPKKQGQLYKAQDTHTGNLLEVMHGTRGSRRGRSPICIFPHWPSAEAATRRGTTRRACHVSHLSYMMYNLMHCILSRASRSMWCMELTQRCGLEQVPLHCLPPARSQNPQQLLRIQSFFDRRTQTHKEDGICLVPDLMHKVIWPWLVWNRSWTTCLLGYLGINEAGS